MEQAATSELYDFSGSIKPPVDNHANTALTSLEIMTSRVMRKRKQQAGKKEVQALIQLRDATGYWDNGPKVVDGEKTEEGSGWTIGIHKEGWDKLNDSTTIQQAEALLVFTRVKITENHVQEINLSYTGLELSLIHI